MAQIQTQSTTTHLHFPHDPNTELLHLSTKARKYVHLICTTDFKAHLPSPSSPLNSKSNTKHKHKHNPKRVSFSSSHTIHSWPKNVSILRGLYGNTQNTRATDLPPSASKASPTSSILKKEEKETDIEVEPEPEHPIPSRRHSFPLARPKLEVFHKLSELVSRSKRSLSQTFVGRLREEEEEDTGEGDYNPNNDNNHDLAIFDFGDALTPLPFPTNPHGPPLRRYSSPEIDLICPFEHPADRNTRFETPTQNHLSSSPSHGKRKFALPKGSGELARAVTEKVRRLSGGKGDGEGDEKGERNGEGERGFYGPLWTKKYDLDLPRSIRPDYDEVAFLMRMQREERERVGVGVGVGVGAGRDAGDRALDVGDGDEGEIASPSSEPGIPSPSSSDNDDGREGDEEKKADEDVKWNQRLAAIAAEIDELLVRTFREGHAERGYRDGWSERGFRIWRGNEEVVGECERERENEREGDEEEEEEGIKWRIPVY